MGRFQKVWWCWDIQSDSASGALFVNAVKERARVSFWRTSTEELPACHRRGWGKTREMIVRDSFDGEENLGCKHGPSISTQEVMYSMYLFNWELSEGPISLALSVLGCLNVQFGTDHHCCIYRSFHKLKSGFYILMQPDVRWLFNPNVCGK